MSVFVTLDGFDKLLQVVDAARFTKEIDKAVYPHVAEMLRDEAKKLPPVNSERTGWSAKGIPVAPKYGGSLRQSIQKRKLGLLAAEVYAGVNYGGHVHEGTSRSHNNYSAYMGDNSNGVPARPWFKWLLEDFGGKEKIEIILTAALERVSTP